LAVGAVLLFVLDLLLTVALISLSSLSSVALHRMSTDANGSLAFLSEMDSPASSYRVAAHVARQLSLLGGGVLAGAAAARSGWGWPWAVGAGAAALLGVLLVEVLVARSIALRRPRSALRRVAPALRLFRMLLLPIVGPLQHVLSARVEQENGPDETAEQDPEEEVEAYFEVGEREGILEAEEGKMMRSIVDLGDTLVREIMTPRPDIQALPMATTVAEARRSMLETARSRMPVYREDIDNIVGILHLRDLVRAWDEGRENASITPYLRTAFFVPETQTVDHLLSRLRTRTNMALVVDEYGGIAGLVTLEDTLEEIVGDIRDEHDAEEDLIQKADDGSWLMSGLVHVEKLEEMFGVEFPDRDFDTVGGLVVSRLGKVPEEGESLEIEGLRIVVEKADPRRVYQVRIEGAVVPEFRPETE
jgi:CBS domain containing-hemolysin-like protein